MAKVFDAYFCNNAINDYDHNYDHNYLFVIYSDTHILKSDKIPNYQISFTKDRFRIEYKDKAIYDSYNEDLIYWTSLEELKIKLDRIMIFQ